MFLSNLQTKIQNLTKGKDLFLNEVDKHSDNFWHIYDIPGRITIEMRKKPKHELQSYSYGCNHGHMGAGMCICKMILLICLLIACIFDGI